MLANKAKLESKICMTDCPNSYNGNFACLRIHFFAFIDKYWNNVAVGRVDINVLLKCYITQNIQHIANYYQLSFNFKWHNVVEIDLTVCHHISCLIFSVNSLLFLILHYNTNPIVRIKYYNCYSTTFRDRVRIIQ